jgi:hypothetical protein
MSARVGGRTFKRVDSLSRALRALLAVGIVVDIVNIGITFLELRTLERYRSGVTSLREVLDAFDRSRAVGIVVIVVFLSTVVPGSSGSIVGSRTSMRSRSPGYRSRQVGPWAGG